MRNLNVPMYDPEMVRPMREELTRLGFEELRTPDAVDAVLASEQAPTLVVVNSVCGCAARNARPAAALAIQHDRRPARGATSRGTLRRRHKSRCSRTGGSCSCWNGATSRAATLATSRPI